MTRRRGMTRQQAEHEFLKTLADVMQYASARGLDITVQYERGLLPIEWQMFWLTHGRGSLVRFFTNCSIASCSVRVTKDDP